MYMQHNLLLRACRYVVLLFLRACTYVAYCKLELVRIFKNIEHCWQRYLNMYLSMQLLKFVFIIFLPFPLLPCYCCYLHTFAFVTLLLLTLLPSYLCLCYLLTFAFVTFLLLSLLPSCLCLCHLLTFAFVTFLLFPFHPSYLCFYYLLTFAFVAIFPLPLLFATFLPLSFSYLPFLVLLQSLHEADPSGIILLPSERHRPPRFEPALSPARR